MNISVSALIGAYDAIQAGAVDGKGQSIKQAIDDATAWFNLPPLLLYAVSSREVNLNVAYARGATGDGGHGHGMWQDDDRWNKRDWRTFDNDVRAQVAVAAEKLSSLYKQCGGWFEACNAYNGGVGGTRNGNDTAVTASGNSQGTGDYGPDTIERWATLLLFRNTVVEPHHAPATWGRH
jgi:hypothetical protein